MKHNQVKKVSKELGDAMDATSITVTFSGIEFATVALAMYEIVESKKSSAQDKIRAVSVLKKIQNETEKTDVYKLWEKANEGGE